jgi:hypothetical protein
MQKLIDAVNNARDLDGLCDALNNLELRVGELSRKQANVFHCASDYVDHCGLPVFGQDKPKDVGGIYSYDDDRCIIKNVAAGNVWVIVDRTPEFGA